MEPDVKFVGVKLEPGVKVKFPAEDDEGSMWTIHITQFALAHPSESGKNVITLINDDEEFVLGTLEKDRVEQFQVSWIICSLLREVNLPTIQLRGLRM